MFAHQPARQDAHARLRGMLPHCRPEQEDKRAESKKTMHFLEVGLAKILETSLKRVLSLPSDLRAPLLRSKAGFKHFCANKRSLPRHVYWGMSRVPNRKFPASSILQTCVKTCSIGFPAVKTFMERFGNLSVPCPGRHQSHTRLSSRQEAARN